MEVDWNFDSKKNSSTFKILKENVANNDLVGN